MKKTKYILIGILFIALFVRLYQSRIYAPFWLEQADDMVSVRGIWQDIREGRIAELPLKGQTGTYRWSWIGSQTNNPIYHGVFYYYLLLPAAVIGNFSPYAVILFLIGLGVAIVYLLYEAGRLLFDDEWVGLVAAALGAVSFWLATYSRFIWTPSTTPFFSLLSLVAFLHVSRGQMGWWYVLAFSLSAGSQVHNSGYVPLLFFLVALGMTRPRLPESFGKKVLLFVTFLLPIFPTMLYEIISGFTMTRALVAVGGGSSVLISPRGVAESLGTFFLMSVGFVHLNNRFFAPQFSTIIETVRASGPVIAFLLGILIIIASRKKLLFAWWLTFLFVPLFIEFLYIDQQINEYSRMNNLVFALPAFLLGVAWILVNLWRRNNIFLRSISLGFMSVYLLINWTIISTYMWRQTDLFWGYGELSALANRFPSYVGTNAYALRVFRYYSDDHQPNPRTYELLYLLDIQKNPMPETFNGVAHWSVYALPLRGAVAQETIYIIDREYVQIVSLPQDALQVAETANMIVYRSFEVQ